jgi:phosphoglycolate phosphatase-like HAD superfamily hydrolase
MRIRYINQKWLSIKMGKKLLIFDFDGTVVDTKTLYYKSIYNQLRKFGFSYDQVDRAIDVGMSIRNTLRKMGFSFIMTWYIKKKIMKNVEKGINEVKKCKDTDSIRKLKGRKIVVSNSLREFVIPVIRHLDIEDEFEEVYGAEDFPDKEEFISQYIKKRKLNKKDVYYIGDRAADAKLAKSVGINSVIVVGKCTWDPVGRILKENPDFLINDLKDIGKII